MALLGTISSPNLSGCVRTAIRAHEIRLGSCGSAFQGEEPPTVESKKLEHGCRMIDAGSWVLNRGPSNTHPQTRALIAPNSP